VSPSLKRWTSLITIPIFGRMAYIDIFRKSTALIAKLGEEKAHTVWAMARYLEEPDLEALAATALTDGPDDKKNRLHLSRS
jgi:hypothetical protein